MSLNARVGFRYDTAANWTSNNPTLLAGEAGFESDTGNLKVGDGTTAWASLAYAYAGIDNVVEDTTPQLGGDLDVNGNDIVSTANGDINILPNGTGNVKLGAFTFDADQTVGAGQDNYVLTYDDATGLISLEASADAGDVLVSGDIGVTVQGYDADTLFADTADTLTAGFDATSHSGGTLSTGTYTPDPADGNFQHITNGGAFTLAPPASVCTIVVEITNNGSAGTITTSGFTDVDGDSFTTTDTHVFQCFICKTNTASTLTVRACQ